MKHLIPAAAFFTFLLSSCDTKDPVTPDPDIPPTVSGVYIVNEGGFGKSTSSLSLYVPDSGKSYGDVFFAANGRGLGDVANDMVIHDGKGYIVMNNSHRIEVISMTTHLSLGTVQLPGNSPYQAVILNAHKGYVTNYYKGSVSVFDPATFQVVKEIPVGKNPKGIALHDGFVYVCNSGDFSADSTLSIIDAAADSVVKTVTVGLGPNDAAVDGDGDLFVRCYGYQDWGNPANSKAGSIAVVHTGTRSLQAVIPLPLAQHGHPGRMAVSKKGTGYVATGAAVLSFDTKTNALRSTSIERANVYGVAVDDVQDRVYLTDAADYVRNGTLFVYSAQRTLLDSATVGIVPGRIVFQ